MTALNRICALLFAAAVAQAQQAWYVDCAAGNDAADGRSPNKAWRTTRKASEQVLSPGDSLLFRRAGTCAGKLWPHGAGSPTAPIRVGAWGEGPLPRIEAEPGAEAAFRLFDQAYWTVANLEFIGGNPHGIYVGGSSGVIRGIHIRDVVVHDVGGSPRTKEGGLVVVAPGSSSQRFEDVEIDGVTAYRTSQWSGILVGGTDHGVLPPAARSSHVAIRNSIAHDVAGDGIVLFQINDGVIENNVAWHTGMQETQTIGTPDGIWTWMCGKCLVRRNEAFLTDSPGIDGGAFDIDYGNDRNTVEENYGHDTQGYCVSVFGAGGVTTQSVVRKNVCIGNGRSPRLALIQGALFFSTWNGGKLEGVTVEGNRFWWDPPIAAPAILERADIVGTASLRNNTIQSSSPLLLRADSALRCDANTYRYGGASAPRWIYGGKEFSAFKQFQNSTGQEPAGRFLREPQSGSPGRPDRVPQTGWALHAAVSGDPEDRNSRALVAVMQSVHRQYPALNCVISVAHFGENLRWNWNTGSMKIEQEVRRAPVPVIELTDPQGVVKWSSARPPAPGDLGIALRSELGPPHFAQIGDEP